MNEAAVNDFIGADWVYRTNDCWTVFRRASAAVFGHDIPEINGIPAQSSVAANRELFDAGANRPEWRQIDKPVDGCAVLFFTARGRPVHIGLYVTRGNVLHCPGSVRNPGRTSYDRLRELRQIFHELRFYEYLPDNNST